MVLFVSWNSKTIIYYLNNNKNIINDWFKPKKKSSFTSEVNLCCVDTVHTNRLERTSSEVVHNRLCQNQYRSLCSQISPGLTSSARIGCFSLSQRVDALCWRAIRRFSGTEWREGNPIPLWLNKVMTSSNEKRKLFIGDSSWTRAHSWWGFLGKGRS